MSFIGSSELWGEDATARLCQILLEANDGMAQQIAENRTDLLDLLEKKDLEQVDDCGLSLQFLAVYYDRPDMIRYLHKRGIDLSRPCDPMEFGTPMFYAVSMGKIHIVETLDSLGISVGSACDGYLKLSPSYYASRIGDPSIGHKIRTLMDREVTACRLFKKNFDKQKARKRYLRIRRAIITIQRYTRGFMDRVMVKLIRSGAITLDSNSIHSGSSATGTAGGGSYAASRSRSHAGSSVHKGAGSQLNEGSLDITSLDGSQLSVG